MRAALRRKLGRVRLRDPELAHLFEPPPDDRIICLDTEATGLDPRRDQLLAVAALPVEGDRIRTSEALHLTVRPNGPVDGESVKIHGLRDRDLARGMAPETAVDRLLQFIGSRPLLGYYLEFDCALIGRLARPRLGGPLPNRRIEVSGLYHDAKQAVIPRGFVDLRFEAIRRDLGIPDLGRHDAFADVLTTALMYVKLGHRPRVRRV
ncbi:3'-5' exonuclease [Thiohalorhabdus methylotrophus]|uniref:3'-5' exonuclease n=1 Tax=Thiohalorhabdus methylotrophus TaxID=3242694 RepID=A0ABV4TY30_9GAMM